VKFTPGGKFTPGLRTTVPDFQPRTHLMCKCYVPTFQSVNFSDYSPKNNV